MGHKMRQGHFTLPVAYYRIAAILTAGLLWTAPLQAQATPLEDHAKAVEQRLAETSRSGDIASDKAAQLRYELNQTLQHKRFLKRRFGNQLSKSDEKVIEKRLASIEREIALALVPASR
jgi:hypothetical protein